MTRPGGLLAGIDIAAEFAALDNGFGEPPETKPDPDKEKNKTKKGKAEMEAVSII